MTHTLKTWPEYFKAIESGDKNFDLRKADRLFAVGDTLVLQEFDTDYGYTGKELIYLISYILREGESAAVQGIKKGFCILGLKEKESYA